MQPVIQIWQPDGPELVTLTGRRSPAISLAWKHSGDQLASGGRDNTINLWDFLTGALITSLAEHTAPIRDLAFSPDDQLLASASEDHRVKLWDLSSGSPTRALTTLMGHTDQVNDVTFSPAAIAAASQQPLLASASVDKTIKLWTLDGALVTTLDRHTAKVQEVVFSPDGRLLFSASGDNTVIRWDLDAILQLDPLDYACDWVRNYLKTSPTLSPGDRQLCEP
ncbi:MAG: WD40 repeat domain-containing protein [Leptolyngbya sp. RL_3_1]|nr:WD40 repeat domain-containing protein [Leptolyngbya sp. RL_3_1]